MSDKNKSGDKLVYGASPRADLLPPELKAESKLRAQRRGLIGVALLAVVLVAGAYAYTLISATAASVRLTAANAQTESLRDQQLEFVEVRELKQQLVAIENSQLIGVSTEIDWEEYFNLVQVSLPAGTTINTVSASTSIPGSAESQSTNPLQSAQVATISFSASSPTLPSVSIWIDGLAKLPGFADATANSIRLDATSGVYTVEMTMHVNFEALANRFGAAEEEEAAADGESETATGDDEAEEEAAE